MGEEILDANFPRVKLGGLGRGDTHGYLRALMGDGSVQYRIQLKTVGDTHSVLRHSRSIILGCYAAFRFHEFRR